MTADESAGTIHGHVPSEREARTEIKITAQTDHPTDRIGNIDVDE